MVATALWQARTSPAQPALDTVGSPDHHQVSYDTSLAGLTVVSGPCTGRLVGDAIQVVGGTETDRARLAEAAEAAGLPVGSGSIVRLLGSTTGGAGDVVVVARPAVRAGREPGRHRAARALRPHARRVPRAGGRPARHRQRDAARCRCRSRGSRRRRAREPRPRRLGGSRRAGDPRRRHRDRRRAGDLAGLPRTRDGRPRDHLRRRQRRRRPGRREHAARARRRRRARHPGGPRDGPTVDRTASASAPRPRRGRHGRPGARRRRGARAWASTPSS